MFLSFAKYFAVARLAAPGCVDDLGQASVTDAAVDEPRENDAPPVHCLGDQALTLPDIKGLAGEGARAGAIADQDGVFW